MSVAIICDSSCCLPRELVRQRKIIVVPISYQMGGEVFRDGELDPADFYARLRVSRNGASTQTPSPGDFLAAFREAQERGAASAVCLTLPESYSGTYLAAKTAADEIAAEFPVRVVDTGGLALVHGFAVLAAAREAERCENPDQIASAALRRAGATRLVGAVDSTYYLAKSGRVPLALHWAASALRLRPVFAAEGTKIRSVGRARTPEAATVYILSYIARSSEPGAPLHFGVMHADARARADALAVALAERFNAAEMMVTEFTPVMGVHTGPGLVAVAYYAG
jgi:DegV family protein with EDD domain